MTLLGDALEILKYLRLFALADIFWMDDLENLENPYYKKS